jgi:uncharacterized protein Yka (UPF0111/DUF47 family)
VRARRWFLPETPDLLGMLRAQADVTIEGMEALAAWAHGDAAKGETVRELEHAADERRREVQEALTEAFTTPLDPEDLFVLSRGLDAVLNGAKDLVREAEVMALAPDEPMADMADLLLQAVRHLAEAFAGLGRDTAAATAEADAAVKSARQLERSYRAAMGALLQVDDLREVMARRELYRRLSRIADGVVDVAERVWYAIVKQA